MRPSTKLEIIRGYLDKAGVRATITWGPGTPPAALICKTQHHTHEVSALASPWAAAAHLTKIIGRERLAHALGDIAICPYCPTTPKE